MNDREFDLVLFGASSFVGKLTAEYLAGRHPARWAIAGRSRDKLAALGLDVPILVADALDPAACEAIARRARVVCTTVGPYAKYGSALVAACAAAGTHYCDLTGEVPFMRAMIDAHHARAKQTGARIVHACGFDSIPSDLGTWAAQQEFHRRFGRYASRVTALFGETSGGLSGGTAASAFGIAEAMKDPEVRRLMCDPHALDPERGAARSVDEHVLGWNARLHMVEAPFFMAGTNAPVVRRGHALAGYPWGKGFAYRVFLPPPGTARGLAWGGGVPGVRGGLWAAITRPRLRAWLQRRAPQPGEGPSAEKRAAGHWKVRYVAEDGDDVLVYVAADPAGDPGYASTAKMLGESALCLAYDPLTSEGGVTTPSVAMDGALLDRLRGAGLTFAPA
jgi:short subunit dehydrogenase-like uncharacterized protein